jgi:glycosyltransferase involved in cell wall biosynthesis
MWAFTGGCHYAEDCDHFHRSCGNCFFLKNPGPEDLSHQIWSRKQALYKNANMTIVTSSHWLQKEAQDSGLLADKKVLSIPSTLDTTVFKVLPVERKEAYTILFQAMNINDKRKGLKYFLEALKILRKEHPEFSKKVRLLVFGKNTSDALSGLEYPVDYLGFISDQNQIAQAYNRCDTFVIPSLGDNLPNAVIEAMACGKPVVAFDTGGIPEMVDHQKNGYIAPQKDVQALADGIKWILEDSDRYQKLSKNALQKVEDCYTYEAVIGQYRKLYQSLIL